MCLCSMDQIRRLQPQRMELFVVSRLSASPLDIYSNGWRVLPADLERRDFYARWNVVLRSSGVFWRRIIHDVPNLWKVDGLDALGTTTGRCNGYLFLGLGDYE